MRSIKSINFATLGVRYFCLEFLAGPRMLAPDTPAAMYTFKLRIFFIFNAKLGRSGNARPHKLPAHFRKTADPGGSLYSVRTGEYQRPQQDRALALEKLESTSASSPCII